MSETPEGAQIGMNETPTCTGSGTKLTHPRSLTVLASDLRRLRPNYTDKGKHRAVSTLIEQCHSWENGGNRDALRGAMEAAMQTIERDALRQGDRA